MVLYVGLLLVRVDMGIIGSLGKLCGLWCLLVWVWCMVYMWSTPLVFRLGRCVVLGCMVDAVELCRFYGGYMVVVWVLVGMAVLCRMGAIESMVIVGLVVLVDLLVACVE